MKIWVDADACPQAVKHILYKAANRKKMPLILVANHYFQTPPSPYIQTLQVEQGFDIADDYIVKQVSDLDLVITSDIPLADEAISKGARVMTPRGEILDKENIKARLTFRDLSDNLRASGIQSKGPAPLNNKDIQKFANGLDRILARSKP